MQMETLRPARKVYAATLGAPLATLLIYLFEISRGEAAPVPEQVATAVTALCVFLMGYFVPPGPGDGIKPSGGQ